jgi:predicted P-loop ATPase
MEKQKKIEFLCTLSKDKVLIPTVCMENVCRILQQDTSFKGTLKLETFKGDVLYKDKKIVDENILSILSEISIKYPFLQKVNPSMVRDAIMKVSFDNQIDLAKEHFTSLVWDKVPRLDTWLSSVYGTPDDEYHRAVGSNFLKAIVKRVMIAGCKFDHVFVLEGKQGIKKSTSIMELVGHDYYCETSMSTETKDFFSQFHGNMIVEFSEGATASRTDIKRMKSIITVQVDKFRLPYDKFPKDFPRRCVFAMTTNEDTYLKDDTGNRRWLPVKVLAEEINIDWLKENRDQLFAEAYHRVITLKETIHEFPKEETLRQQELRQEEHPWSEIIQDWYWNTLTEAEKLDGVSVSYTYDNAINKGVQKTITRYDEIVIGSIFLQMGLEKRRTSKGGARINKYFLKDDSRIFIPQVKTKINGYEF